MEQHSMRMDARGTRGVLCAKNINVLLDIQTFTFFSLNSAQIQYRARLIEIISRPAAVGTGTAY
jgi:hypothetical protein